MPNYCNFETRIKGNRENILKLADWLSANYVYSRWEHNTSIKLETPEITVEKDGKLVPTEHHIGYRVFSFEVTEEEIDGDTAIIHGFGDCAWSVYSCMFKGPHTYTSDNKNSTITRSITLDDACALLGVECEIFSWEPGCCFAEHYYINADGEIEEDEETEYSEIWLGDFTGDTWEEYVEYCKEEFDADPSITKEQFENSDRDCIALCDWWKEGKEYAWDWRF